MAAPQLTPAQTARVVEALGDLLPQSASFRALSPGEQAAIRANTSQVAALLRDDPVETLGRDPYAIPLVDDSPPPPPPPPIVPRSQAPQGVVRGSQHSTGSYAPTSALAATEATGSFLREVNFPSFVAELVKGTFQAIVESSIEQMRAYGELVQSVVMSTNEFRDQNVSENQARDHLVQTYPNVFQLNVGDTGPRVGPRNGGSFFGDDMPDFGADFPGLGGDIGELNQENIEQKLVPAARDHLARSRQRMLATMVLMGINRIIVTDGKINAKVRFDFKTQDRSTRQAMAIDYSHLGTTVVQQNGGTTEE